MASILSIAGGTFAATETFDGWADRFSAEWARLSPQFATQAQYFSGEEQDAIDRTLSMSGTHDYTRAALERRAALARRGVEELKGFPASSLTRAQQTSAGVIRWALEHAITAAKYPHHQSVFDQFRGLQLHLVNFLTQTHPIRSARDVENYLARLERVAPLIDEGIAEGRAAAGAGFLPPRFIVERTIEQLDGFLAVKPDRNVFVTTLDTRLQAINPPVDAAARNTFVARAEKLVSEAVIPAYRRVRSLLAEQLPHTTADAGVWRLPNGAAYYQDQLAKLTTTTLTADEIHAIGQREVARIEAEMDVLLSKLGVTRGSINERYGKLEAAMQPPSSPDPRVKLLADVTRHVRLAEERSAQLFTLRPRAPVEVRREPAFSEATAAAHYTAPAPDGSRPGVFWYPLPGPVFNVVRLRSLAYHEAVPGHHFQVTIQQESADLPRFRKLGVFGFISAYGEGWGLYAERLADENGWYDGDTAGRIGYLWSMRYRAQRLVADTGLHAKKWTRERVMDYGLSRAETERYVVWPGQATAYMIGQLRLVELREKARRALGARFTLQEFHARVLRIGSVPLNVLADEMDAWISEATR